MRAGTRTDVSERADLPPPGRPELVDLVHLRRGAGRGGGRGRDPDHRGGGGQDCGQGGGRTPTPLVARRLLVG